MSQEESLTPVQREVDGLIGNALALATDGKTMTSLFTAGLVGRLARLGIVGIVGKSLAPWAAQGISQAVGLAGESAVFAGMGRAFASLEGHAPVRSFQKEWAGAAISLGCIKILGGATRGQNLIAQHLLIDGGIVAGHHVGHAFGLTEKPEGSLAQQVIQAEGMNLAMKGSLALLHGFSPRLSALEISLDLAIEPRVRESGFVLPALVKPLFAGPSENIFQMSQGEGPKKPTIPSSAPPRIGGGPPIARPRSGSVPRPTPSREAVPPRRGPLPPPPVLPPPKVSHPAAPPHLPPPPLPLAAPPKAKPTVPRPDPPPRVRLSFTPPAPSVSVEPMSSEQILLLTRMAQDLPSAELRVLPVATIAAELSHTGSVRDAQQYFEYAASLIESLPDHGALKGRAFSHLALQKARVGDSTGCKENFGQAMQALNRLQENPQRTLEGTLEAYELAFSIAGDLIGAGRADTADQFLSVAGPNYQRVLRAPPPLGFGHDAVMKLARGGFFEEAMKLAGKIPNLEGQRKILFKLGNFYARRQEMKKADEVLWRLRGHGEKDPLHAEIARAHALRGDWPLALQNLSAIKEMAQNIQATAFLARASLLLGEGDHARAVQEEAVRLLRDHSDLLSAEARFQISAVLASNYSLWGDRDGHSRFYYRALGERDLWRETAAEQELGEAGQKALAEVVFGLQVANEGEKIGEVLKDLDRRTKSRVMGETAFNLTEAYRDIIASAWLGLIPESDRSAPQRKVALALLNRGHAEQGLALAERIPDPVLRFDTLWEILAETRGAAAAEPLSLETPPGRGPPPLPTAR